MTETMNALRIINEDDVRRFLSPKDALSIAETVLIDQAGGKSALSTPSSMTLATGDDHPRFKFKAATVGAFGVSGVRLIASPPARPAADGRRPDNWTALFDHDTGSLMGLVAQNWISNLRTAAFGVASVRPLLPPRPLVIGLFGSGRIAREMAPLLDLAFDIAELRVNSRRPESMNAFVGEFSGLFGDRIRAESDGRALVDGADLVITLTEARTPLVRAGWLKPGAVVCSMGSHNEIDFAVLDEVDRFIVDDADYAAEMGEGGAWIGAGLLTRDAFERRIDATAAEVVSGKQPGRFTADDRILAIVQGMAIGDIAFAAHALAAAQSSDSGVKADQ